MEFTFILNIFHSDMHSIEMSSIWKHYSKNFDTEYKYLPRLYITYPRNILVMGTLSSYATDHVSSIRSLYQSWKFIIQTWNILLIINKTRCYVFIFRRAFRKLSRYLILNFYSFLFLGKHHALLWNGSDKISNLKNNYNNTK